MGDLLVVYASDVYPLRGAVWDHLYSFRRYSGHRCHYLNLAFRGVPSYIRRLPLDLVVFHTIFLYSRFDPPLFRRLMARAAPLRDLQATKVILPQDEHVGAESLCRFVEEFSVDHVFTVAPPTEWAKIYGGLDRNRVKLDQVLTGYLDPATVGRIDRLSERQTSRPIDVGYRARHAPPSLGRQGRLKVRLAERVRQAAGKAGISVDASTAERDTLYGDDWLRFLLRSRYTVGAEGGASVLDLDGKIRRRTAEFTAEHPEAGFDEVAQACFPESDGGIEYFAISPRHLEACATRTCQILVEGRYSGVLQAGRHYLEVNKDLGNLEAILSGLGNDDRRREIVDRAYEEIVASGRYAYPQFVAQVLKSSGVNPDSARAGGTLARARSSLGDLLSWLVALIYCRGRDGIKRGLPAGVVRRLKAGVDRVRWGRA